MRFGATIILGLALPGCGPREIRKEPPAMLVAHRGASHAAPECTLPAYRLAIEENADGYEGDFWLTKDGRIVCIHDADTRRVTQGQSNLDVRESTLEELRALDVGSWKGAKFAGSKIPTIEEVIELVPAGKRLVIEIKDDRLEIVTRLKEVLERSALPAEQTAIIAFDPEIIRESKRLLPEIRAFWLYSWYRDKTTGARSNSAREIVQVATEVGADGIDINKTPWVDASFAMLLRSAGLELHVYTVNDVADAARLLAIGVDSITTDRPAGLRAEIEKHFAPTSGDVAKNKRIVFRDDGSWEYGVSKE